MNNQRSVDEATLQMIVQRSFDAQQATEKLIKAHHQLRHQVPYGTGCRRERGLMTVSLL